MRIAAAGQQELLKEAQQIETGKQLLQQLRIEMMIAMAQGQTPSRETSGRRDLRSWNLTISW